MPLDLSAIGHSTRLLFEIPLRPLQGERFQPTGFPNLGAASYSSSRGQSVLLESCQSMANRLELTIWDAAKDGPVEDVEGISHVTVKRKKKFLTDSMLEAHRINSPYLLEGKDKTFFNELKKGLGELEEGPIDRKKLAEVLLKYDVGSLLHGAFLAKKELAGGRLRVARALSAFIEADGARVAASGGVKNDHVNPSGVTKDGFGNVPFARDEYTAERITLYASLDLSQIRGYRLEDKATKLLVLLGLFKLRSLLDGDLRLRTACDLEPVNRDDIQAKRPLGFSLPDLETLRTSLKESIKECAECADLMKHTTITFEDDLKKGKGGEKEEEEDGG